MHFDALVTAREAQDHPGLKRYGVCRHLIYVWRTAGRLVEHGKRGRSPLYRWGEILQVERDTRVSGQSHRTDGCRSCARVAERVAA